MKTGRPKTSLGLTSDEVAQVQSMVASRSIPQGLATRARMILLSQDGLSNAAIARKLGVMNATVGKWRRRFAVDRLAGLHDARRPGRHRTRTDEEIARLVQKTLRTQPQSSRWGWATSKESRIDSVRHDTTTWFAALNVATGTVFSQCRRRHRHQEFLAFLRHLDISVPKDLAVHLIVDNYATHKHPQVRTWLASRPRSHVHDTPTYASWLNHVELWFRRISQQAIRRGSFGSVKDLVATIDHFVQTYNSHARPFAWTAPADSILAKVRRLCERISGTQH